MPANVVRPILTRLGTLSAHPLAFGIVVAYGIGWYVVEPHSFDLHGVATLATWLMTLVITRSEHRDTQALHAKLDELLLADQNARDEVARVDEKEPEEVERHREARNRETL